jgi:hypothetical protein
VRDRADVPCRVIGEGKIRLDQVLRGIRRIHWILNGQKKALWKRPWSESPGKTNRTHLQYSAFRTNRHTCYLSPCRTCNPVAQGNFHHSRSYFVVQGYCNHALCFLKRMCPHKRPKSLCPT